MSFQSLKEIINNNIIDILSEIGEGTKPFPFTLISATETNSNIDKDFKKYIVEYKIETPNFPILVTVVSYIESKKYGIFIDFQLYDSSYKNNQYKITNEGLQVMFGILTTIKEIVKNFLNRFNLKIFSLTYISANSAKDQSASDSEKYNKALKRHKLYVAYIKKLFPEAIVNESRFPLFKVKVFFRRLIGVEDLR